MQDPNIQYENPDRFFIKDLHSPHRDKPQKSCNINSDFLVKLNLYLRKNPSPDLDSLIAAHHILMERTFCRDFNVRIPWNLEFKSADEKHLFVETYRADLMFAIWPLLQKRKYFHYDNDTCETKYCLIV